MKNRYIKSYGKMFEVFKFTNLDLFTNMHPETREGTSIKDIIKDRLMYLDDDGYNIDITGYPSITYPADMIVIITRMNLSSMRTFAAKPNQITFKLSDISNDVDALISELSEKGVRPYKIAIIPSLIGTHIELLVSNTISFYSKLEKYNSIVGIRIEFNFRK